MAKEIYRLQEPRQLQKKKSAMDAKKQLLLLFGSISAMILQESYKYLLMIS